MNHSVSRNRDLELPNGNVSALEYAGVTCKYAGIPDGNVLPAKKCWDGYIGPDLKEFFDHQGFVVLRKVLNEQEVSQLRRDYCRLAENWQRLDAIGGSFDLEQQQAGFVITSVDEKKVVKGDDLERVKALAIPAFRKLASYRFSEAGQHLAHHPALVDFLSGVIGQEGYLFLDAFFPKVARLSREKPWHHDADLWLKNWTSPNSAVQTMTVVDAHRAESGALQVIPGSHLETWEHRYDGESKANVGPNVIERAIYLELEPGDILVFSSMLLHASMANRSPYDRCVVYNAFSPPRVVYQGTNEAPVLPRIW